MKHYFFTFVSLISVLLAAGCAGFSQQPVFTDISGNDVHPVKLVKTERMEDNTVHLYFAGAAAVVNTGVFMPATGTTGACTVEAVNITGDVRITGIQPEQAARLTGFAVTPAEPIGIGDPFVLHGSVSDGAHSVLDFALPFEGANTRPARIRMTEIRPLYSSKPKSEFIEFTVMQAGNLAGITVTNVGDKKNPHYTFPAAEVSKGEVIVYHWRSVEEGICDELSVKTVSGGTQACTHARDFWGPYSSIPKRNANVILIQTRAGGDIQDAILYCTEKEFQKQASPAWPDEQLREGAQAAAAAGVWQGKPDMAGASITALTASKSLSRSIQTAVNNANAWILRDSKAVTMGTLD